MATATIPTLPTRTSPPPALAELPSAQTEWPLDNQRAHPGDRIAFVLLLAAITLMASMLVANTLAGLMAR